MTTTPRGRGPAPRPFDEDVMRPVIRTHAAKHAADQAYRDAIRQARKDGATLEHLRSVTGLSKQTLITWTAADQQTRGCGTEG